MARIILTLAGDITARDLSTFATALRSLSGADDTAIFIGNDPNNDLGPTIEAVFVTDGAGD